MENLTLEIEKNVFEGYGLARYEGRAVFIKGAIKGEVVEAKIVSKNKNYLRAEIIDIIKPSKYRIKPFCPMYNPCGACDMGFIQYDYLLQIKEDIIKEIFQNFQSLEFKPIIKSPEINNYRCKTQFPTTETKKSKKILAGYYKEKSHEIVNIKYCPIQPSVIDDIIQYIRENWSLSGYIEKTHKGLLRHILTRISDDAGDILLTFVLNLNSSDFEKIKKDIGSYADEICGKFPKIKGVFVNLNNEKTNKITGKEYVLIKGQDYITEKLEDKIYKLGPDSFFQVNPKCAVQLFNSAKNLISKKGTLLDLYGGLGTIGIFMKEAATKIVLVEENKEAIKLAKENYKLNEIKTYEVFEGKAKDKIQDFIKEKRFFENIVIDPPRKGSDDETLGNISKMTNSIIYISCNPMTLKRDAENLIKYGFNFKSIQAVDMFPYTHHIECVAHFVRENK